MLLQQLISHPQRRLLSPCALTRGMALYTGHKKTSRVNHKKRKAKLRQQHWKPQRKNTKEPTVSKKYNTPTPPDYPYPGYKDEPEKGVETPLMLASTASPYVYVPRDFFVDSHLLFTTDHLNEASIFNSGQFLSCPPCPQHSKLPEVAFLGRSNVGKSSLINTMMNAKLALTSKQPGRTQRPYYYGWKPYTKGGNTITGYIVDLPGYGYARGPKQAVARWQKYTQEFLLTRQSAGTLQHVFLLQDARLGRPQRMDDLIMEWLEEHQLPHTIVLTKCDDNPKAAMRHANLCSAALLHKTAMQESTTRSPFIHVTSAKKNFGIMALFSSFSKDICGLL